MASPETTYPRLARIDELKLKLKARKGNKAYDENRKAIQAEIDRLEGVHEKSLEIDRSNPDDGSDGEE